MLIHVIPRAALPTTSVLTYKVDRTVSVGQLVQVPLRGRSIPAIVVKNNGTADTAAKIQPVRRIGTTVLSETFSHTLERVAAYYATTPAHIWQRFGPNITAPYLQTPYSYADMQQQCVITPAHTTPLFTALATRSETIADDATTRRQQWQRAAAGHSFTALGGISAICLPWRSLSHIILDTPLASPYRSNRSPGISTAVVACLVAHTTGAALTIRSPLPLTLLRDMIPAPDNTTVLPPKLHPITTTPLGTKSYINTELLTTIAEQRTAGKRILVYINRLPRQGNNSFSINAIANDLAKRLDCPVAITRKGTPTPDAPVIVATTHALYEHSLSWDVAIILSLEGLLSPNQPHSPMVAAELLATLASRTPVYAQYQSADHPFVQAAQAQLAHDTLMQLPRFTHRLITVHLPKTPTSIDNRYVDDLSTIWPNPLHNDSTYTYIAPRTLTETQRTAIQRHPRTIRIFTDDTMLPTLERVDT